MSIPFSGAVKVFVFQNIIPLNNIHNTNLRMVFSVFTFLSDSTKRKTQIFQGTFLNFRIMIIYDTETLNKYVSFLLVIVRARLPQILFILH